MAKKKSYASRTDLRAPLIICAIIGALLLTMFLVVVFVEDGFCLFAEILVCLRSAAREGFKEVLYVIPVPVVGIKVDSRARFGEVGEIFFHGRPDRAHGGTADL